MGGLTSGDLKAITASVPFEPDVPLVVAVRVGQSAAIEHRQGRWPDGVPVAPDDQFYGASLAKQVTGAAIAVLCNRGMVDPTDRLGHFMPDLPVWARGVTVLQALGHTAGLPPAGVLEGLLGNVDWTTEAALSAMRLAPPPVDPQGSRFDYSNVGYVCLARVIEEASGHDFASFVHDELLRPLGVTGMTMARASEVLGFRQVAGMGRSLPMSHGDGGLWTTASGFTHWLACQNHDILRIAERVESPAHLTDGTSVDYGWGIGLRSFRQQPLFVHGGSWRGASCRALRSRAFDVCVAILSASGAEQDNVGRLANLVLDAAI